MIRTKFNGLIAATVTPMDKNGEISLKSIDNYAEFLVKQGVKGVFLCGTTGEGLLLNSEERKMVTEAWMKHADKLKILVHVGSTGYKIAGDLAKHAQDCGAHAISAMGPCFLQPQRVSELVQFNKRIAENADHTPYYYYHIPSTSGVKLNMVEFLEEAEREIPTLNGIKYTSYDTMQMQECINFNNKSYDILHGHDETLLMGLILGAEGGIGTTYNVTGRHFNKLIDEFNQGNIKKATAMQAETLPFIHIVLKYVNAIVGIKAILNIMGVDCGPCRLPLQNLSVSEMKSLEEELKTIDWLC